MIAIRPALALLALGLALLPTARAGDDPLHPAGAPALAAGRMALLPAHQAWRERQVVVPPVTEERQVPITEVVMVPVYGTLTWSETRAVEVPRYRTKKKAVKVKLWNPFKCFDEFDVKLWDRKKCVQDGTEVRQEAVPHREQVIVGDRAEVRVVGYRTEQVVVTPARVETVRECVPVPDQWVTLGPPGTPLLPGTGAVMTEADYRVALFAAVR